MSESEAEKVFQRKRLSENNKKYRKRNSEKVNNYEINGTFSKVFIIKKQNILL